MEHRRRIRGDSRETRVSAMSSATFNGPPIGASRRIVADEGGKLAKDARTFCVDDRRRPRQGVRGARHGR